MKKLITIGILLILSMVIWLGYTKKQLNDQRAENEKINCIATESVSENEQLWQVFKQLITLHPDSVITIDTSGFNTAVKNACSRYFARVKKELKLKDSLSAYINTLRTSDQSLNLLNRLCEQNTQEISSVNDSLLFEVFLANEKLQLLKQETDVLNHQLEREKTKYAKLEFSNEKAGIRYFGEVCDGMACGFGIGLFSTKAIYEGNWKNNKRHGYGKYTWSSGDVYEGDYVNGRREGYGTYTFASGERYEGEWQNDLRNGTGTFYAADNSVLLKGTWQQDKFKRNPAEVTQTTF